MRRTAALLLAGGLLLTGCSDDKKAAEPKGEVPTPVATIPVEVAGLPFGVGEYVVDPSAELSEDDVAAAVGKVRGLKGVQSSKLVGKKLHVEILPDATQTEREVVLRQLAALGKVSEGI